MKTNKISFSTNIQRTFVENSETLHLYVSTDAKFGVILLGFVELFNKSLHYVAKFRSKIHLGLENSLQIFKNWFKSANNILA